MAMYLLTSISHPSAHHVQAAVAAILSPGLALAPGGDYTALLKNVSINQSEAINQVT